MAWTVAVIDKTVFGNKKVHVLSCTADAAESTIDTGLDHVDYHLVGAQSFSTGAPAIYDNVGSTATALAGFIGCSGFVSGDVFHVVVFGR